MAPLPVHRLLSWALAAVFAVFAVLAGCAASPRPPPAVVASTLVAELPPLPPYIVASAHTVLRLPEDPTVRLAFPRFKLPLRIRPEARGLVAEVDGAIRVSGIAKLEELGVVMCEAGPVGSHFYAGNGNLLTLRSGVRGGRVRVAGLVNLRLKPYAAPQAVPASAL